MSWATCVLRERLAAEGLTPSAHREAIDEIAEHLNDLHRGAIARRRDADEPTRRSKPSSRAWDRWRSPWPSAPNAAGALARASAGERRRRRFRARVRALRLNRGFSAIVILTLAIGVGACTAVFSIINALLLGSLPFPNPEQLTSCCGKPKATTARAVHRREAGL